MFQSIGFLGTGQMGGALAQAAVKGAGGAAVLLANRTPAKAQALADQLDDVSDSLAMVEDYVYSDDFTDLEDEDDEEDDDAEEALEALEEDGFFELECPNCGDTLVVDKSVLDSGSVACPGCGQEFEIELGYEDEEEDSDEE